MVQAVENQRLQFAVVLVAVVLMLLTQPAVAVKCSCYNGITLSSSSCDCACKSGYLPPTCSFGIADTVRLIFYINQTSSDFVSELFTAAVSYAASGNNATFIGATANSLFNTTSAIVSVQGYLVQRVLDSVTYRDPWVAEYKVISAYVVTPSTGSSSSSLLDMDYQIYAQDNVTVTVMGVVYLAAALILCILLVFLETCCTKNTEEDLEAAELSEHREKRERRKDKKKKGGDDAGSPRRDNYVTPTPK